jgi:hypothetical protein
MRSQIKSKVAGLCNTCLLAQTKSALAGELREGGWMAFILERRSSKN